MSEHIDLLAELDKLGVRAQQVSLVAMMGSDLNAENPEAVLLLGKLTELYSQKIPMTGEFSLSDLSTLVRKYELTKKLVESILPRRESK